MFAGRRMTKHFSNVITWVYAIDPVLSALIAQFRDGPNRLKIE